MTSLRYHGNLNLDMNTPHPRRFSIPTKSVDINLWYCVFIALSLILGSVRNHEGNTELSYFTHTLRPFQLE